MMKFKYKRAWLLLLIPIAFLTTVVATKFPEVFEYFYSRRVHLFVREVLGRITGWIPFSLAELVLVFGVLLLIIYIICYVIAIIKNKKQRREKAILLTLNLFCISAIIYAWFVFTCGLNYHRQTFADYAGLEIKPASVAELSALCEELVLAMNEARSVLPENAVGVSVSTFKSSHEMAKEAADLYANIADKYALLGGYTPRPKPVLFSRLMSVVNITGFYFPYTLECNINTDIPDFEIPSTMMHEIAHFKGFMREQEANFIAYLACIKSDDPLFNYSGLRLATVHATNALYLADREEYQRIMQNTTEAVRRDMRANSEYWRQFETTVAEVATAMNDTYLRANRQEQGVKSYGEMVDLLIAYYRE